MGMLVWTARIRAARAALRLGQRELAAAAGVARSSLVNIEMNRDCNASSLYDCQRALEGGGVEFWEVGGQSGIFFPPREPVPFAAFCRATRAAVMATQERMAAVTKLSSQTVAALESGTGSKLSIGVFLRNVEAVRMSYIDAEGRHGLILPPEEKMRALLSDIATGDGGES